MELSVGVEIVPLAALPSAATTVAGWYHDAWGREDGLLLEVEQRRLHQSLAGTNLPATFLALVDARLVGSAQLKLHEMSQLPQFVYWLGSVYVAPEARGGGVAGALVNFVAEQARLQGVERLYLQTEDMTGGLYHRHGWGPVSVAESHGKRVLIMERRLGPNNSSNPMPLRGTALTQVLGPMSRVSTQPHLTARLSFTDPFVPGVAPTSDNFRAECDFGVVGMLNMVYVQLALSPPTPQQTTASIWQWRRSRFVVGGRLMFAWGCIAAAGR